MSDDAIKRDLVAYVDHELSDEEVAAVEAALKQDGRLRGMLSMLLRQRMLLARVSAEAATPFDEAPAEEPARHATVDPITSITQRQTRSRRRNPAAAHSRKHISFPQRVLPWLGYAAALLFLVLWLTDGPAPGQPGSSQQLAGGQSAGDLPTLAELRGADAIDGATVGTRLERGRRLALEAGQQAGLRYDDGTAIQLRGPAQLVVSDDKDLRLDSGRADASVAKQTSGKPFRIATPYGEVQVVGTAFGVSVTDEVFAVDVSEGVVEVWPEQHDGYRLRAGERIKQHGIDLQRRVVGTIKELEWNGDIELQTAHGMRHFQPQWRGGMPADGGGPDKQVVEMMRTFKVGEKVSLRWFHDGEHDCVLEMKRID